jgi:hypothetical protein
MHEQLTIHNAATRKNESAGGGAFGGVPHPGGMHRLVEDTVSVPHVHPIGMHPYRMPCWWWYFPFLPSDTFLTECKNTT